MRRLDAVIAERRLADPQNSYVAALLRDGLDRILRKVGEECAETLLAAKNAERDPAARVQLVRETADLWFHCLVMLASGVFLGRGRSRARTALRVVRPH
jgi:phosphoribosyl-ATP pyrophosphohydrolase